MSFESDPESRALELTGAEFQQWLELVGREIGSYLDSLPSQPAFATENHVDVADEFDLAIDSAKSQPEELVRYLFDRAIPCSFNTASPGYLAYIPGGGLPESAIADLIASATNRYMGVWAAAPVLATIEQQVIRWMCNLFGLSSGSGGILTTGGSLANWTAMVTARTKLLGEDFLDGVLYCSDQAHHCIQKAAKLCGVKSSCVRVIATNEDFQIRPDALRQSIEADLEAGLRPFFVAANAGTTNTGAVDDLVEIQKICNEFSVWFHVDAAYGGFFALTERGKQKLQGIELADSIVVDPHKGLFLPYGTGALLVRRVEDLRQTHRIEADYLPAYQEDDSRTDFHAISPELSRDFRGLRIWLPLKIHGTPVFRDNLDEKLDLTDWIYEQLSKRTGKSAKIEWIAPPQLSVVAFCVNFDASSEAQNDLNRELLQRINQRKRVHLTSTWLNGRFVIRICVLSFRTHIQNMKDCLEDICEEIANMENELSSHGRGSAC